MKLKHPTSGWNSCVLPYWSLYCNLYHCLNLHLSERNELSSHSHWLQLQYFPTISIFLVFGHWKIMHEMHKKISVTTYDAANDVVTQKEYCLDHAHAERFSKFREPLEIKSLGKNIS